MDVPPPPAPPPPGAIEEIEFEPSPFYENDWTDVPAASDTLAPREAPEATLARYRADPDFRYNRPRAERPSLWSRFWDWVQREILLPLFQGAASDGGRLLLIALVVLLLGWGLTRLLRADVGPLFARRDVDKGTAGPLLDVDDIAEVDLHALLADALREGRHRDAVRFRYLVALQDLDARGFIRWSRHKTNREYVREARTAGGAEVADPFAEVTRVFDFVWYGERPVDAARYPRLGPLFDRLDAALGAARRQPVAP